MIEGIFLQFRERDGKYCIKLRDCWIIGLSDCRPELMMMFTTAADEENDSMHNNVASARVTR